MELKTAAYAALVFAVVSGSFLPVLLALAKGVNIYEFFFFMYMLSVPTGILLLAWKHKLGKLAELVKNKRTLLYISLTGLLIFVPIEFGISYSEHFITASLATAIFRTNPLLVLIFLPVLLRERLTRKQIAALTLGVIGLYIGVTGGNVLGLVQDTYLPAVMLLTALTFGYAISIISVKKFMFDTDVLLAVSAMVMFLFFSIAFVLNSAPLAPISLPNLLIMAYLGIFFNIFSFYISFYALKTVKISLYTNAHLLSPFLTFVWAFAFLGEPIEAYYLVIAGLVTAGIIIQHYDFRGGSYLAKKGSRLEKTVLFDVTGVFAESGEAGIGGVVNGGGRVLAVKLHNDHHGKFNDFVKEGGYDNVYTDSHPGISKESRYVKEILGAGPGEFVIMKVGKIDENEDFFEKLHTGIDAGNKE